MWNTVFYHPIVNLLLLLYKLVGDNLGLAIIAIVVLLRLVLWPLTALQMKSQKNLQKMQPKLQKFQGKKADQMTMQEMGAVKDVAKGCALGCLPTLVQLPFLIALYNALRVLATSGGTVFNDIAYSAYLTFPEGYAFNTMFLGLDLAIIPSELGFKTLEVIPYLALALLVAVSQWLTTKLMTPPKTEAQRKQEALLKAREKSGKKAKKSEEVDQQEMMSSMNNSFTLFLPLMIAVASFSVPAALGVYWFVQSLLLAIQTGLPKGIALAREANETGESFFSLARKQFFPPKVEGGKKQRGAIVKGDSDAEIKEGEIKPIKKKANSKKRNRSKKKRK